MRSPRRAATAVLLMAAVTGLAGCGGSSSSSTDDGTAPLVGVAVDGKELTVQPTQYCLDGQGQRYTVTPPILEVTEGQRISLRVPDAVAASGWGVQVWDEKLAEKIGTVDVPAGTTTFDQITSSDVVPPTFYLVVVEDKDPERCSNLSGAWPVGFIRTGTTAASSSSSASSSPAG